MHVLFGTKMKQTIFSMLIGTENLLCVYRNYDSEPKYRKFRTLRIIFEILLFAGILSFGTYETVRSSETGNALFYFMIFVHCANYLCACTTFICAVQNSAAYKIFARNVVAVHQRRKSKSSQEYSRKLKNFFIVTFTLLIVCGICLLYVRIIHRQLIANKTPTIAYVILISADIISEIRFSMEHIIFYAYISMIKCLLESLNKYIMELQASYERREKDLSPGRGLTHDPLIEKEIEAWADDYIKLVTCSKSLSKCFSFQMIYSLCLSSVHYIFSFYCILYIYLINEPYKYVGIFHTGFMLVYALCSTNVVLYGGQRLLNEAAKTKTCLLKLNNTLSIYPTTKTKSIKNLYLLVKSNPIKIEYTGKVTQGMYLIPMILSLSVSYVIIALQFNHLI